MEFYFNAQEVGFRLINCLRVSSYATSTLFSRIKKLSVRINYSISSKQAADINCIYFNQSLVLYAYQLYLSMLFYLLTEIRGIFDTRSTEYSSFRTIELLTDSLKSICLSLNTTILRTRIRCQVLKICLIGYFGCLCLNDIIV